MYVGMLESSKFVFLTYHPPMPGDRRRGPRGLRRAEETLQARAVAEAVMDEAARQDATLAAAEAPLPQYFISALKFLCICSSLFLLCASFLA
jgi:hypothetical protein